MIIMAVPMIGPVYICSKAVEVRWVLMMGLIYPGNSHVAYYNKDYRNSMSPKMTIK